MRVNERKTVAQRDDVLIFTIVLSSDKGPILLFVFSLHKTTTNYSQCWRINNWNETNWNETRLEKTSNLHREKWCKKVDNIYSEKLNVIQWNMIRKWINKLRLIFNFITFAKKSFSIFKINEIRHSDWVLLFCYEIYLKTVLFLIWFWKVKNLDRTFNCLSTFRVCRASWKADKYQISLKNWRFLLKRNSPFRKVAWDAKAPMYLQDDSESLGHVRFLESFLHLSWSHFCEHVFYANVPMRCAHVFAQIRLSIMRAPPQITTF